VKCESSQLAEATAIDRKMTTAVFIPVRLDSTRLPQKALREIAGKPALQYLIERLKLAQSPDLIVICTTTEPGDAPLQSLADAAGVELFRGDKDDLLARFHAAAEHYQVGLIINVDGDDLLVDPEQVDAVAQLLKDSGADFITCEGLPFGAAAIGIRAEALASVCARKSQTDTATGWGAFFANDASLKTRTLVIDDPELRHPEIRMTLDYEEDFQFFSAVFAELARQGKPNRLREALALITSRPDIQALNSGLDEKYWAHFHSQAAPSN